MFTDVFLFKRRVKYMADDIRNASILCICVYFSSSRRWISEYPSGINVAIAECWIIIHTHLERKVPRATEAILQRESSPRPRVILKKLPRSNKAPLMHNRRIAGIPTPNEDPPKSVQGLPLLAELREISASCNRTDESLGAKRQIVDRGD